MSEHVRHGEVGDLIDIEGPRVGGARRTGEILEVLGPAGHEHYRVRWEGEDSRETLFYPTDHASVVRHRQRGKEPVPAPKP